MANARIFEVCCLSSCDSKRSHTVTSDSMCRNFRRVSRITKGIDTGSPCKRKCGYKNRLQAVKRAEISPIFFETADPLLALGMLGIPSNGETVASSTTRRLRRKLATSKLILRSDEYQTTRNVPGRLAHCTNFKSQAYPRGLTASASATALPLA